jgi:hypothetical protein
MPKFHTAAVTAARNCIPLKTSYIVISNRGDEHDIGDIELSFNEGVDSFLLEHGERERFWGDFTHLCFKRSDDGHTEKIRLDIFEA